MSFAKNLSRLKTLPRAKGVTTFNAPGNYVPVYGRTTHKISGAGNPGTPGTGGEYQYSYEPEPAIDPYVVVGAYLVASYYLSDGSPSPGGETSYFVENQPYPQAPYTSFTNYGPGSQGQRVDVSYTYISYYSGREAIPGHDVYGPYYPGAAGTPSVVMGVPFPGGASGTPAPSVPETYVNIQYTSGGTTITVPPGGYVNIRNL